MLKGMAPDDTAHCLKAVPLRSIQPGGGLGPWLLRLLGGPSLGWFRNVCRFEDLPQTAYLFTAHPLRLARAGLPEAIFFSLLLGGGFVVFLLLALNVCGWYGLPAGLVLLLWL